MAKILLVDDHTVHLRMYSHTLRKHGHMVVVAGNGRDALSCLTENDIDLVITDLAMPEMDGLMLLKHLRADERYQALPVIMLTASGQDQDQRLARNEGVSAFLTKPTGSRELIDTVHRLLGGRIVGGQV